jgi:hypothetical protein
VDGVELAKKIKRLIKKRGLEFFVARGARGNYFSATVLRPLKNQRKKIGPGLLHDMLKQSDLTKEDLS